MDHWGQRLAALPPMAQRALLRANRISVPRGSARSMRSARLRAGLCRAATLRARWVLMPDDVRRAAHEVAALPQGVPYDTACERWGPLRGWSALYADPVPQSALEWLVLAGWMVPAPVSTKHPPRLQMPAVVRRLLPVTPVWEIASDTTPPEATIPSAVLVATWLLEQTRQTDGAFGRLPLYRQSERLCRALPVGESARALLLFVRPLLQTLGLLLTTDQHDVVASAAVSWRKRPVAEQQTLLVQAWIRTAAPDRWLPVRGRATDGMDWPIFRQRLLRWADVLPAVPIVPPSVANLEPLFGPLVDGQTHGFRQVSRRPWNLDATERCWQAAIHGPLDWLGIVAWTPDGAIARRDVQPVPVEQADAPWTPSAPIATVQLDAYDADAVLAALTATGPAMVPPALLQRLAQTLPPTERPPVRGTATTTPPLSRLEQAIAEREPLLITYADGARRVTRRTILPLACWQEDDHWWLRAWCCTRLEERTFRLDRVRRWGTCLPDALPLISDDVV